MDDDEDGGWVNVSLGTGCCFVVADAAAAVFVPAKILFAMGKTQP